ncbi:MAG: sigma-54-dependent Fis family transcriptional regulator [Myxococcales bacterium]|nr:sigma-54-dependent Fis family transcriptional regulator [Myxococcales bacterium]
MDLTVHSMSAPLLIRVLLALDDDVLRERVRGILDPSHVLVTEATSSQDGWKRLPVESHDLALFDALPDDQQLDRRLARARRLPERPDVVVLLERVNVERQAELISAGCLAALERQLPGEALDGALSSFINRRRDLQLARLAAAAPEHVSDPDTLVASSPSMRKVVATARRLASTSSPVLILGETGVGKERVASLLHAEGPRARGPFVAVNCAAIPSELFESELFGHERGAFTGATRTRRGRFELADQGTLFLDEVGEVPLNLQAKLLRVLQTRRIEPVGSERSVAVNVRIVAATNRDLLEEVEAKRFRRDLYYRLCVVEIMIPPLRERVADIPELVETYLRVLSTQTHTGVRKIAPAVMEALTRYAWPGNVRELVNVIERATLLCSGDTVTLADLPSSIVATLSPDDIDAALPASAGEPRVAGELPEAWLDRPWKEVRGQILHAGERSYLDAMLARHGGKIGVTAAHAGLSPRSLFEKMRRHGLRKEDYRKR